MLTNCGNGRPATVGLIGTPMSAACTLCRMRISPVMRCTASRTPCKAIAPPEPTEVVAMLNDLGVAVYEQTPDGLVYLNAPDEGDGAVDLER